MSRKNKKYTREEQHARIYREVFEDSAREDLKKFVPIDQIMKDLINDENDSLFESNESYFTEDPSFIHEYQCAQLSQILVPGFKKSKPNEQGYCESLPAISALSEVVCAGYFDFLSSERTVACSFRYKYYMDSPTIVFRERDKRILLFLPEKGEKLAIMGSGLYGYAINEQYSKSFDIQYVYLTMRQPQFIKQFPLGLSNSCLLNGYVLARYKSHQESLAMQARVKSQDILNTGLYILKNYYD